MLFIEDDNRSITAKATRLEEYCRLEGLNELFLLGTAKKSQQGQRKAGTAAWQVLSFMQRLFQ